MPRHRARSPEAKRSRRDTLLDGARRLLLASGTFDTLRIHRVAQEVGLAKGTVYMYFASKEALLVALFCETLVEWTEALVAAPLSPPAPPEALADALLTASAEVPLMAVLSRVLFSALEPSADLLATSHQEVRAQVDRCCRWLADARDLPTDDALALLQQLFLVLVGMAQFGTPLAHGGVAAEAPLPTPTQAVLRSALVHLMTGWTLRRSLRPRTSAHLDGVASR